MTDRFELFEFVPANRKYWFIRTQGGTYYDEFAAHNFIAIGWSKITEPERLLTMKRKDALASIIEAYPDEKRPGKIYNQLFRFFQSISENDVVMIPSDSSSSIMFGIVESVVYMENNKEKLEKCHYKNRRKVKWVKSVKRDQLDPYLYKMTRPQNTISDASDYAPYIDRTIESLFVKGDKAHMVIPIRTNQDISALDLYDFMDMMFTAIKIVNSADASDEEYSRNDLDIKLNVQSPGVMEYISNHAELMFGIGMVLVFIVGGSVKFKKTKEEIEADASSDGFMGKLLNFLIKKKDQEIELIKLREQHLLLKERLKYELPKEIINLPAGNEEESASSTSDTDLKSE